MVLEFSVIDAKSIELTLQPETDSELAIFRGIERKSEQFRIVIDAAAIADVMNQLNEIGHES